MPTLIDPSEVKYVEIFPPVGIARVGNSEEPDGYFIGPEIPNDKDVPTFKDGKGAIKRQAARFRVYAYSAEGKVIGELNHDSGYTLEWKASIANSKAAYHMFHGRFAEASQYGLRNQAVQKTLDVDDRTDLIISAVESVQGVNQTAKKLEGKFKGGMDKAVDVYLGELHTDDQGRLVFLGGRGHSYSPQNPTNPPPMIMTGFDEDDWVDDISDGSITVSITHSGSSTKMPAPKYSAWVICAPPKFAWGSRAPTSLYDVVEEVYEAPKRETLGEQAHFAQLPEPEFYKDIWPIFLGTHVLSWLNPNAMRGHGLSAGEEVGTYSFLAGGRPDLLSDPKGDANERKDVFKRIRYPLGKNYDNKRKNQKGPKYMPRLNGEQGDYPWAALTELQYQRLQKWLAGNFTKGTDPDPISRFEDLELSAQPQALTQAALEWSIGAPLYPGIETYWRAALPDWYCFNTEVAPGVPLNPPFRIDASKVRPGHLTRHLSLPWQSDFYMCQTDSSGDWWPSTRPDKVVSLKRFMETAQSVAPAELAKSFGVDDMKDWDRAFEGKADLELEDNVRSPRRGSHNMVVHWSRLPFVVPPPGYDPSLPPILVEGEVDPLLRDP